MYVYIRQRYDDYQYYISMNGSSMRYINSVKEISALTINIFMRVAPLLEKKDQNELQVQTYNGMHMIQDKPTEHSRTTILKCYLANLVCFVIQWKYVSPCLGNCFRRRY